MAARVKANRPAAGAANFSEPTVTYQRSATTGYWSVSVAMTYSMNLNFIFFRMPMTLSYSRQANVYAPVS